MGLSGVTTKFLTMKRPLVAGVVGPPELDVVVEKGLITYLEVSPTSRGLAQTYFPLGYEIKGGIAYVKILIPKTVLKPFNALRNAVKGIGSLVVVSEAEKEGNHYVFRNGIMIAVKCSHLGLLSWHVTQGLYPPLELKEEPLYKSPHILALVESIMSGYGLYEPSFQEIPIVISRVPSEEHKIPPPLSLLLTLPAWRAHRLASHKETLSKGSSSEKGKSLGRRFRSLFNRGSGHKTRRDKGREDRHSDSHT